MIARSEISKPMMRTTPVLWRVLGGQQPYAETLAIMEQTAAAVASGQQPEQVWLLEHPAVVTAGTSARIADLLEPDRFPVFETGRGGQYTYHGPGQRIAYVMLDLKSRGGDVRAFVAALERWLIATLTHFGLKGEVREDRVGVWVDTPEGEAKIAALGIRVRQGVTFHGVSLNVSPDLEHFSVIVPCGVSDFGVTSFKALGLHTAPDAIDTALRLCFEAQFGSTFQ